MTNILRFTTHFLLLHIFYVGDKLPKFYIYATNFISFCILDTGRTSSADPERPCLQKKVKICVEMSIDRPAVTPSNLMYV